MTDEKVPDPTADAAKPALDQGDAAAHSGTDRAHTSEPAAQQPTVDALLQDLMDDTDEAALYQHLLSIC